MEDIRIDDSFESIFDDGIDSQGWDKNSQVILLITFLEAQNNMPLGKFLKQRFIDFIDEQVDEENKDVF